jgi:hypothetical protein
VIVFSAKKEKNFPEKAQLKIKRFRENPGKDKRNKF